jgi:hypothetical protein
VSGASPADQPPDLSAAILGFRIWSLGVKGTLGAIAAGSIWNHGVNEAVCCPSVAPSKRPKHSSPHPGCVCGFNAFAELGPKLRAHQGSVLGAIAAWGDIDVYRAGFRAQYARVVALALPPGRRVPAGERERLELAAERYSVPLLAAKDLEAEGLRHASPVPPTLLPATSAGRAPRATSPAPLPGRSSAPTGRPRIATWDDARGNALWVRGHVALRCRADVVELAPAPGAAALLGADPPVRTPGIGERVEAGGVVAAIDTAYPGRRLHLLTPIGGTISALNPGFAAGLLDGDRGVSSSPWLVGLRPDVAAPLDDAPLLWGRPGAELYRLGVMGLSDADVLAELAMPAGRSLDDLRPLPQAPSGAGSRLPLADHQRLRTSLTPERGRRAAIMVGQLRPLLHAVGGAGPDDLLVA